MFGNVAESLLKMMGQSGNVPGAILAEDVDNALQELQRNLDAVPDEVVESTDEEDSNRVALRTRAIPLIELLQSAKAAGENVLWES